MLFEHELKVRLVESTHQYFDQYENEYTSNGGMHKRVIPKFDPEGQILKAIAKRDKKTEAEIKAQWAATAKISNDRGTLIHNNMDAFWRTGAVTHPEYEELANSIYNYFGPREYKSHRSEHIVFFPKSKVAGTIDLDFERTKKYMKRPVIDIFDYKTQKDGIENEGKYLNYYNGPLGHLLHSNYTEIALKMSTYALMVERTWDYAIGQLAIIYIPPTDLMAWHLIPVPYMKQEAIAIVNYHNQHAALSV